MARDRGGPALALQVLVYPVTDHRVDTPSHLGVGEGYGLRSDEVRYYWRQYLADEADGASPSASPRRAPSLAGLPPALVLTAEFDPLRDEGEAYAAKLRAAGVPVTLKRYAGAIHGFLGSSEDMAASGLLIASRLREALRSR